MESLNNGYGYGSGYGSGYGDGYDITIIEA